MAHRKRTSPTVGEAEALRCLEQVLQEMEEADRTDDALIATKSAEIAAAQKVIREAEVQKQQRAPAKDGVRLAMTRVRNGAKRHSAAASPPKPAPAADKKPTPQREVPANRTERTAAFRAAFEAMPREFYFNEFRDGVKTNTPKVYAELGASDLYNWLNYRVVSKELTKSIERGNRVKYVKPHTSSP